MLETFVYKAESLFYWYVLIGSHVMDQGTAKTRKGAESKAARSQEILAGQLGALS